MANVNNPDRREFLKKSGAVTAAVLASSALPSRAAETKLPPLPSNPHTQMAMPTRNLGKTGYKVGIFATISMSPCRSSTARWISG
jgi:hypothetical protein